MSLLETRVPVIYNLPKTGDTYLYSFWRPDLGKKSGTKKKTDKADQNQGNGEAESDQL